MKFGLLTLLGKVLALSHPSRGAWIEIPMWLAEMCMAGRRTPRGVRGLKLYWMPEHPGLHLVAPLAGCVD